MTCHAHVTESASLLPSAFSLISLTAEHAHGVSRSLVGGGAAGGACRGGSYSPIGGAEPPSAGKRRKEKMEVRREKIKSIYKSGPSQYPFNSLVM